MLAPPALAEPGDAARAMMLAAEAGRAGHSGDRELELEKMQEAAALRPDFPQLVMKLASAQVANGRLGEALATLERAAALGIAASLKTDEEFAPLRGKKEFEAVARRFLDNGHPKGRGEIAFTLRNVTGLIEGMAWREKTGEFFFGDAHGRCVWRRAKDNTLSRFTAEGAELLGVFGLAADENQGALWAATSAVRAMRGYSPEQDGTAALAEIDLDSGQVRRVLPVPADVGGVIPHQLRDVAVLADGTVIVSDGLAGTLWRLAPGAAELERWIQDAEMLGPQGLALTGDGTLFVADRINGLLALDPAEAAIRRPLPPAGSTLVGIDGLAAGPGGDLVAIQNATSPKRVLRLTMDSDGSIAKVAVLEAGHLTMSSPTGGCFGPGAEFYFIGNSGASRFALSEGEPSAPRPVPVFKTRLAGGSRR